MRWTVFFLFCMIFNLGCSAEENWKTYQNSASSLSFIYPASWQYESCISGYKTGPDVLCLGFQAPNVADTQDYEMLVELRPLSLEASLNEDLSFEKKDGKWIRHTQLGTIQTKEISGDNWKGFYVEGACKQNEIYNQGDCLFVVLKKNTRNNQSLIVQARDYKNARKILKYILPSIKF